MDSAKLDARLIALLRGKGCVKPFDDPHILQAQILNILFDLIPAADSSKNLDGASIVAAYLAPMPRITKLLDRQDGPFIARVYKDGTVKIALDQKLWRRLSRKR